MVGIGDDQATGMKYRLWQNAQFHIANNLHILASDLTASRLNFGLKAIPVNKIRRKNNRKQNGAYNPCYGD